MTQQNIIKGSYKFLSIYMRKIDLKLDGISITAFSDCKFI